MVRVFQQTARDQALAQCSSGFTRSLLPLAGACMLGGFVAGYFGWPSGLLHLFGLYLLAEWMLPRLRAADVDSSLSARTVRVTLTPDLISIDPVGDHAWGLAGSCHGWQELRGYQRFPQHRVLLVPDRDPVVMPCSLFSRAQLAALDVLLRSRVMKPPVMRLSRLRPLLVGAALAGAWVWEVLGRGIP